MWLDLYSLELETQSKVVVTEYAQYPCPPPSGCCPAEIYAPSCLARLFPGPGASLLLARSG